MGRTFRNENEARTPSLSADLHRINLWRRHEGRSAHCQPDAAPRLRWTAFLPGACLMAALVGGRRDVCTDWPFALVGGGRGGGTGSSAALVGWGDVGAGSVAALVGWTEAS